MNYFTSIKNNYYFSWQIELLIESFKEHKLQNQLYISLDDDKVLDTCKNLKNHDKIILGNDYGGNLNKPCRLLEAIEANAIEFPIALIHPDMVLYKPIKNLTGDIVCSVSPDEDEDELKLIKEEYQALPEDNQYPFLPVGSITVLNNSNTIDFLKGLVAHYNNLEEQGLTDYDKIALSRNLYDFYEQLEIKLEPMETTLLHNNYESNFIHYKYGIPPSFMKYKFEFTNPYELFASFNSTTNLQYVSKITKKLII